MISGSGVLDGSDLFVGSIFDSWMIVIVGINTILHTVNSHEDIDGIDIIKSFGGIFYLCNK